ncbi:MAG: FtsW/RodA/SpoVE family cell cycle protein, partial [Clostridia bacterium]|nr:FtsW/RodA/SpoVE family cell cycle protein [Clostridia bacterium]
MMLSEDRRSRAHFDIPLTLITFALAIFGVLAIAVATYTTSSSSEASLLNHIVESTYSLRQAIFLLIAPLVIGVMVSLPYDFLRRRASFFYYVSLFILVVVLVTNQAEGVKAWVDIIWGFTVQPTEFAKLAMILILAKTLARYDRPMSNMRDFWKIMLIVACPSMLNMAQGEMGTLLVMVFIFGIMLYFGNVSLKLLIGMVAFAALAVLAIYGLAVASGSDNYRLQRILSFFNPEMYAQTDAFQQTQSKMAIGS